MAITTAYITSDGGGTYTNWKQATASKKSATSAKTDTTATKNSTIQKNKTSVKKTSTAKSVIASQADNKKKDNYLKKVATQGKITSSKSTNVVCTTNKNNLKTKLSTIKPPNDHVLFSNIEQNTIRSGNFSATGLYAEIISPSINKSGISFGSARAGVASITHQVNNFHWTYNTLTASANGGINPKQMSANLDASMFSGEVGIEVPQLDFYIGIGGFAGGVSLSTSEVQYNDGLITIGINGKGFGASITFGFLK